MKHINVKTYEIAPAHQSGNLNPTRAELLSMFNLNAAITRAKGFRLYDDEGREYLDFLSQYGAVPFGHNPPELWDALDEARRTGLPSMVQPMRPLEAERLADRLAELTPGDLSITTFANSGAETVEAAIKLARIRSGRMTILSAENGFHGKTLGALSATGKPMYQDGFGAPAPDFNYIPYGDVNALRERLERDADSIAAFIFEPIQGEGGVVCPPDNYTEEAIALCRRHGVLSIVDEIQTGMGRTGNLFACSDSRETPDMLLLSKALGGGMMAIGACIVRPSAWDDRFGRLHSSTFANNNLACRVANATLDKLLADNGKIMRDVTKNGKYLLKRLLDLRDFYPEVIADVRGKGYMLGIEFQRFDQRTDSATMAFSSLNGGVTPIISSWLLNVKGLLTAPLFNATHVMRLQPSLIVGRREIDQAIEALNEVCELINTRNYYGLVHHLVSGPKWDEVTSYIGDDSAAHAELVTEPGKFGFLVHYTEKEDIYRADPSFRQFSDIELSNWCEWIKRLGPGFARHIPTITSKTGATAEGWIMSVPMLPKDMRGRGRSMANGMVKGAVDMAAKDGASRVGLGAFTSIVSRGGELATGRGVPITSGNTLTTVSAVKAIENIASRTGMIIEDSHVVVVGASGAIGRLASLMLSRRAGSMTLVGNAANPFATKLLGNVADEVYQTLLNGKTAPKGKAGLASEWVKKTADESGIDIAELKGLAGKFRPYAEELCEAAAIDWTTDLDASLAKADIVVVATSSEIALVDPLKLKPGTLVCDVARPQNVSHAELDKSGVLIFDGGLVSPPFDIDLGAFQTLPKNLCWGCLGETMLLSLARQTRDFSIGSFLSLEDADLISELAEEHGFEPATPQWYGDIITDGEFARFAYHLRIAQFERELAAGEITYAQMERPLKRA